MHDQRHAGLLRNRGQLHRFAEASTERLLADHRNAARHGGRDVVAIGYRRRNDVQQVGLLSVEHLLDLAVDFGHAVARRLRLAFGNASIGERDQFDHVHVAPALILKLAEVTGANRRNF